MARQKTWLWFTGLEWGIGLVFLAAYLFTTLPSHSYKDIRHIAASAFKEGYQGQYKSKYLHNVAIDHLEWAVKALTDEYDNYGSPVDRKTIKSALTQLESGDIREAEDVFNVLLKSKESEGDSAQVEAATILTHIAALNYLNNISATRKALERATTLAPKEHTIWNRLGTFFMRIGKSYDAQNAYLKVLEIGLSTGDKRIIAVAAGNLAIGYNAIGDTDRAQEFYQKALDMHKEIYDKMGVALQLSNLALIAKQRGNLGKSCQLYRESLVLYKEMEMGRKVKQVQGYLTGLACRSV